MEAGNEVGDLAMGLFGDYVEVTAYNNETLDLSKMIENTKAEMQKGTPVICEASFEYNGLYCAVDILKKEGDGWAIYEVKSSTKHENSTDDKPVYIADVAYQKYVLENCGIKLSGTYLVCLNGDYLFLIDEAHNLVDRAREMYSAVMSMTELTHARHAVEDKAVDRRLVTYMDRSILAMSALRESSDESCQLMGNIGSLIVYLTKLSEQLEETLKEGVTAPLREVLMEFYFDIRRFICAFDRSDDRYLIYALRSEDSFEIKIFCVDPSKDLGERLAKGCGAVFFSATLLPVQYYKEMLSDTAASDYDLYVDSPFAEENRLLVAATDVSSRYTRRGRKEYERMAAYIRDIIRGKHGNYMVFFPSYQLMKDVFEVFTEMELMKAGHGLQLVVQESEMSEDARQKFLDAFQADAADAAFCFCKR